MLLVAACPRPLKPASGAAERRRDRGHLTTGWHYLTDVLAGIVVYYVACWLLELARSNRRQRATQDCKQSWPHQMSKGSSRTAALCRTASTSTRLLADYLPVGHQDYQYAQNPGRKFRVFGHVEKLLTFRTEVGTIPILGLFHVPIAIGAVNTHKTPCR